jgi:hypothetical protein
MKQKISRKYKNEIVLSALTALALSVPYVNASSEVTNTSHEFETQELSETENITEIIRLMKLRVAAGKTQSQDVSRFFHAKGHGCLKSRVTILPLESENRVGLFEQPYETFDSIIRFSNGSGETSDKKKNIRGAAVKVLLPEQTSGFATPQYQNIPSQDFLLVTGEAMFIDSVQTVRDLLYHLMIDKKKGASFFVKNAFNGGLKLMWNASRAKTKISSPLAVTYHSASSYAFGEDKAARYSLVQSRCIGSSVTLRKDRPQKVSKTNPDYLSVQLLEDIRHSNPDPICMTLNMQIQSDKALARVEDPHVKWKQPDPVAVAELRIQTNKGNTQLSKDECEDMSFRPWHSLAEHRPLGGLNRLRKFAYHDLYSERVNSSN